MAGFNILDLFGLAQKGPTTGGIAPTPQERNAQDALMRLFNLGFGDKGQGQLEREFDRTFNTDDRRADGSMHSSPLGIKGKARDILGGLGDAFLVAGGAAPQYAPKRMMERTQDALANFSNNPAGALRAYAQVNAPGAIGMQQELLKSGGQYAKDQAAAQASTAAAGENTAQTEVINRGLVSSVLGLGLRSEDPAVREAARAKAQEIAKLKGMDVEIPADYNSDFVERFGMTPKDYAATGIDRTEAENLRDYRKSVIRNQAIGNQIDAARVVGDVSEEAGRTSRGAAEEAGKTGRSAAVEKGRRERATSAAVARVVKDNPGSKVQVNRTTGRVRYSTDGGKTWQAGN